MVQPIPAERRKQALEQVMELYERSLRSQVETQENVGKLIHIDIKSGDYEIGSDRSSAEVERLRERHRDAEIIALRIGYNAVEAIGGVLVRTMP